MAWPISVLGENQPFGQVSLLGLLAEREQFVDFLAQVTFEFEQPSITDGVALGRIGMDLAAVQADTCGAVLPCCLVV